MPADPTSTVVRNLLDLRRLQNGLRIEVDALLAALFDDIVAQLARIDPTGVGAETYRRGRIEKLMEAVEELTGETFAAVHRLVRQRAAEIGSFEADVADDILRKALGGVGVDFRPNRIGINLVKRIVDRQTIEGHLLEDWFVAQERSVAFRVRQQIQLGMAQNETINDMVRRVRGRQIGFRYRDAETGLFTTRGARGARAERVFSGGVLKMTTREAEAVVRTAVNQVATQAQLDTYSANADITEEYEYVATLDGRTTEICMSLDGRVFRYDDPNKKMPPMHWNCRSGIIPRVNWAGLGIDPPAEGQRASMKGFVDASTTYEDWLKDQPADFQAEVLGVGKAKLFRAGKISLRDLVKDDDTIVTLAELQKRAA